MSADFQQSEPSKMVCKDKFHQRMQGKDEPAVAFVTELTRLAGKYGFKERDEQLLAQNLFRYEEHDVEGEIVDRR